MLESQILECLELGPKTRAELARWCGYVTPGYAKNHPFRRALEALISRGEISYKKAKFQLSMAFKEKQRNLEADLRAVSFAGPLSETMEKTFLKLKREYPDLHSKCKDVKITVRAGAIQLEDFSDELTAEELRFLKEYLEPYIIDGRELDDSNKVIGVDLTGGAESLHESADPLNAFMRSMLGENAKYVKGFHMKSDDWEFSITKVDKSELKYQSCEESPF